MMLQKAAKYGHGGDECHWPQRCLRSSWMSQLTQHFSRTGDPSIVKGDYLETFQRGLPRSNTLDDPSLDATRMDIMDVTTLMTRTRMQTGFSKVLIHQLLIPWNPTKSDEGTWALMITKINRAAHKASVVMRTMASLNLGQCPAVNICVCRLWYVLVLV